MSMATGRRKKEIMGLFYKREEPYLYGLIQFFQPSETQRAVGPHRQSAPFVISQAIGKEEVVYGCIFELIQEIRRLIADIDRRNDSLRSVIRSSGVDTSETADGANKVVRVTIPEGETGGRLFFEYTRDIKNILLLLSCQTRILYEIFPRLNSESMSLLDYERKVVGKVSVKEFFDYFVHNRYVFVDGEYVADLFSSKFAKKSPVSDMFMGYRIKWRDYVEAIQRSIEDVKIRDLTGLLKGQLRNLSPTSPHKDIVFLIQNLESLSQVLKTKIPTGKYGSMLNLLFDGAVNERVARMDGVKSPLTVSVTFTGPHVTIHEELTQRKFKIQVRCKLSFGGRETDISDGEHLEIFSRDVGYAEFFQLINDAFGSDVLATAV